MFNRLKFMSVQHFLIDTLETDLGLLRKRQILEIKELRGIFGLELNLQYFI